MNLLDEAPKLRKRIDRRELTFDDIAFFQTLGLCRAQGIVYRTEQDDGTFKSNEVVTVMYRLDSLKSAIQAGYEKHRGIE